ncbi:MAG: hypothetical protein ACRDX8_12175, partial [Acidimicrobiales bacterium]
MSLAGDTANPDLGIIQDALPLGATLPFTDAEWQELLELLASIDPADLRMCELIPGDLDRLPAALELRRCLDELDDLRARLADADGAVNDWELLDEAGPQALADLTASLVDAADWRRKIAGSWLDTVRRECAAKVGRQEWAAFTDCVSAERDELVDMRGALAPWQVSVPEGDDRVEASLHDARERLAAGKGISRLRHSAVSGALDACMVDGRRPGCAEQVDTCLLALQRDRSRRQLDARWANTAGRVGGPPLDPRRPPEDAVAEHLDAIRVALRWNKQAWPQLVDRMSTLGLRSWPDPTIEDLDSLLGAAAVLGLRVRERGLSAEVDAIGDYLGERAQVGESSLWAQLGDAFARRSWHLWDALVAEARRLADLQSGAIRLVSLRGRLAKGAPVFERHLAATRGVGAPTWEQLRLGWQWRQLEG